MNELRFVKLYHVTTPEIAPVIMREGFRDHAAQKGVPGFGVTHTFDPCRCATDHGDRCRSIHGTRG